jgi:O-6-methylguanine DNA methyltransferase
VSRASAVLSTRFGPLLVVVDDAAVGDRPAASPGAVVASSFQPWDAPDSDAPDSDAPDSDAPDSDATDSDTAHSGAADSHPLLVEVAAAVAAWDSGADVSAIDRIPVALPAGGFRRSAWQALREVPSGTTISYAGLAALAGASGAARAAGTACANNPVAPFVPCHRVVRSGGELGGYGYGVAMKRAMLRHEGAAW